MNKKTLQIALLSLFFALFVSIQSCKTGEGCGYEDKYSVKLDKKGRVSGQKGTSNLFSPKQRKRMRK